MHIVPSSFLNGSCWPFSSSISPHPLTTENGPLSEQLKKSEPVVTVRLAELRRPAVAQELSSLISTPFICSFFTSLPLPVDQRSVGAQLNSTQSTVGEQSESLSSLLAVLISLDNCCTFVYFFSGNSKHFFNRAVSVDRF